MTESTIEQLTGISISPLENAPIRVLHVDDDVGFLRVAKQCLEIQGNVEVDSASSVAEALKKLAGESYDAILSDYQMPEKDGLEFLKELRNSGSKIPFIIFTGKGREEVAIEALNLDADYYLNKIGKPETVYGEVTYALKKAIKARKTEQTNFLQRKFLMNVLESMPNPFYVIDPTDYTIKLANSASGFSELTGKSTCYALTHHMAQPCSGAEHSCPLQEVLRTKNPVVVEHVHHDDNGNPRHVEIHAYPILDDQGNVKQMIESCRDITERKKLEESLEATKRRLETLLETAVEGITIVDTMDNLTFVNKAFNDMLGYGGDELLGRNLRELVDENGFREISRQTKTRKKGKINRYQIVLHHKNGEPRVAQVSASPLWNDDGSFAGTLGIIMDITERAKAEQALKASEEKYRGIVELAPDGIITVNLKGVITSVNPAFLKLTGYSEDEIVGKRFTKIGTIQARDIPKYLRLMSSILRGKTPSPSEFPYIRKDGTKCWGEAHASLLKHDGKNVGFQAILRDTTEHKKMLERLKVLNEKLGVVGGLTRHDVRNKLSTVLGNTFLVRQKINGAPEGLKYLSEIESAVHQVERIFDFAKIYETLGTKELVDVDVGEIVEEAVSLFSDLHGAEVRNDCHGLTVLADSLLQQLIYNLIHNSLQHGERVSLIGIRYEVEDDGVKLVYEDDGVGIPKNEKEKIFKKDYGKGTGYGLYLIRRMCEVYGWIIKETGEAGKGAQFTMTIPRMNESERENYRLP